jgi:AcrR family transcriptional regulator
MSKKLRDRAGKQKALISAATRLFAHRGYDATTTREIAAHAGCAEGLIHRYFGGKSGLLFSIVNRRFAEQGTTVHESHAHVTVEKEIRQLMDQQLDYLWKERQFLRVAISTAILQPRLGKLLKKYAPVQASAIVRRLRRSEGCRLSDDKDVEVLAHALMALTFNFGFIGPAILRQDREQAKNLARRAANLLSRAVLTG